MNTRAIEDNDYYENPEPIEPVSEYQEWYDDDLRRRNRERTL